MEICSIGFTKRTAEDFFNTLKAAGIQQLVDVRLNNVSQLAGFAKRDDLRYFLENLVGAKYRHEPLLAPTTELLTSYRKRQVSWQNYEDRFLELMAERRIETALDRSIFRTKSALLCSESTPDKCHRRLVLEYLRDKWGDIQISHL